MTMRFMAVGVFIFAIFVFCPCAFSQEYDILLKGGRVIDAKNNIDGVMDVAIKDGVIARVASDIPGAFAVKVLNLKINMLRQDSSTFTHIAGWISASHARTWCFP